MSGPIIVTDLKQLDPKYLYEVYYFTPRNAQTYQKGLSVKDMEKMYESGYKLVSAWKLVNGNRGQWYKFELLPYKKQPAPSPTPKPQPHTNNNKGSALILGALAIIAIMAMTKG